MKNFITRLSLLGLTVVALAGAPLNLFAQSTNKISAEKKTAGETADSANTEKSAKGGGPFHGKLAALDKVAKTITVGKRTFQITSATKIKKAGKPATLEDGVVGETVSGYVKPAGEGKLNATTVNFGPKATSDTGEKPQAASEKEKQAK
jgi:hypothetical protein